MAAWKATIMFAADPSMVKFPAMVAEKETCSQSYGEAYGKVAASIWHTGTFDATFDKIVTIVLKISNFFFIFFERCSNEQS